MRAFEVCLSVMCGNIGNVLLTCRRDAPPWFGVPGDAASGSVTTWRGGETNTVPLYLSFFINKTFAALLDVFSPSFSAVRGYLSSPHNSHTRVREEDAEIKPISITAIIIRRIAGQLCLFREATASDQQERGQTQLPMKS